MKIFINNKKQKYFICVLFPFWPYNVEKLNKRPTCLNGHLSTISEIPLTVIPLLMYMAKRQFTT